MAIEIEKKYRLRHELIESIRAQLSEFGATNHGITTEENIIFGGGRLDEQGAILRIRKTPEANLLTYKRRLEGSHDAKHQIEHESEFADVTALEKLLDELGFVPRLVYEKRRETWKLHNTEIVIDELPFGYFLEVEGAIIGITEVEMLLGLDALETVHETYPQLTVRFGQEVNGIIESRF